LLDYSEATALSANATYIPIVFSLITWLSLSALVLFVFVAVIAKKSSNRMALAIPGIVLLVVLGLVLIFSIALFFYLDKTSNSADVEEFMISMNGNKNLSLVLELKNVDPAAAKNMLEISDSGTRQAFMLLRIATLEVLKNKEQEAYKIVEITKNNGLSALSQAYELYAESFLSEDDLTLRRDKLRALNPYKASFDMSGIIRVFQI